MKARTFRTKTTTSQTAYEGMRRRAGMRAGALRAVRMAKVTMVMMPERRSRSARIQTAKVVTNWMMTEVATSRIRPTMNSKRRDKTAPTSTLPRDTTASNGSADQAGKLPATAAAIARRRVECRAEDDRRDEQGERELRVERHARHAGEEREARPGEREKRWVGDADVPRPRGEERASNEERDHQLEQRHDAPRAQRGTSQYASPAATRTRIAAGRRSPGSSRRRTG